MLEVYQNPSRSLVYTWDHLSLFSSRRSLGCDRGRLWPIGKLPPEFATTVLVMGEIPDKSDKPLLLYSTTVCVHALRKILLSYTHSRDGELSNAVFYQRDDANRENRSQPRH